MHPSPRRPTSFSSRLLWSEELPSENNIIPGRHSFLQPDHYHFFPIYIHK